MPHSAAIACAAGTFLFGVCQGSNAVGAQRTGATLKSEIEVDELQIALRASGEENEALRQEVEAAEQAVATLQKNLALANSESEVFRRQASELRLRVEALGAGATGGSSIKVEQRLLKAVGDLKLLEDERNILQEALIQLSEAVIRYQKVTVATDPDARLALEAEMRAAAKALGVAPPETVEAAAVASTLTDGMVISLKEELALVVANVGTRHGVKVGMPFQVRRGDEVVGLVRVVDVREKIAGAVIQNFKPDTDRIKVGDRLRVDALQ